MTNRILCTFLVVFGRTFTIITAQDLFSAKLTSIIFILD